MARKAIPITLDRDRELRFTINSLSMVQGLLGKPLGDVLIDSGRLGLVEVRALLWGALSTSDTKLTTAKVGDLMQEFLERGGSYKDLKEAVDLALMESGLLPKGEEVGTGDEGKASQGSAST